MRRPTIIYLIQLANVIHCASMTEKGDNCKKENAPLPLDTEDIRIEYKTLG